MPILLFLIIGIGLYSLTITHTDASGVTRTGLQGLKVYLIPNFKGMTGKEFFVILMDAMGQLFFSISVAMGIMVAYGSYVKKDVNLMKSINQIEIFDTLVAMLAGLMIVPAVFVFIPGNGQSRNGCRSAVLPDGYFCGSNFFGICYGSDRFQFDGCISLDQT